jgi:hypothetical protein
LMRKSPKSVVVADVGETDPAKTILPSGCKTMALAVGAPGTIRKSLPVVIEAVSRILGHASISITHDVYRHVSGAGVRLEMVDLYDAPLPVRKVPQLAVN